MYTDDVPKPEELRNEARELLDVADRFGCKGLKLAAELAESGITVDTAAEIILLADGKTCALLKEAAIEFFASNPTSVTSSSGWAKIRESATLMAELIEVLIDSARKDPLQPAILTRRGTISACASRVFVKSSMKRASTKMAPERCSSVAWRKDITRSVPTIHLLRIVPAVHPLRIIICSRRMYGMVPW
jgi:hypothetical protein